MDESLRMFLVGVVTGVLLMFMFALGSGVFWERGVPIVMERPERVKEICEERIEYFQERLDVANFILEKRENK